VGVTSLILSIIALMVAVAGLVPLVGWLNWISLFLGGLALAFGIVPLARKKRSGAAVAAVVISIIVLVVAILRLIWGGGII
jgi:EamA domain-containing membrane protein RarD